MKKQNNTGIPINSKKKKKICINLENESNCLTQPNIVRFLKFKSLLKADKNLYIKVVGAHLYTISCNIHCTAPEDNYLDFTYI